MFWVDGRMHDWCSLQHVDLTKWPPVCRCMYSRRIWNLLIIYEGARRRTRNAVHCWREISTLIRHMYTKMSKVKHSSCNIRLRSQTLGRRLPAVIKHEFTSVGQPVTLTPAEELGLHSSRQSYVITKASIATVPHQWVFWLCIRSRNVYRCATEEQSARSKWAAPPYRRENIPQLFRYRRPNYQFCTPVNPRVGNSPPRP